MGLLLVNALAVLVLSGLCSLSEAAFLSLPLVRARALAKLGGGTARTVLRIREKVQNAVSAIVILNTIVNVVGTALLALRAESLAERAAGDGDLFGVSTAWLTTIFTVVLVFCGEIIPKSLGERFHVGVCMAAAHPVSALITLFRPFVWIAETVVDAGFPRRRRSTSSREEITEMAEEARRTGAIRSSQAEVIQRVFRLTDITAEDVMTPRIRARMLADDATLEEARSDLGAIVFSRIPLFAGTRDNVTGVVRRADALRALADGQGARPLREYAAKAKFVPATMAVDRLLLEFQKERVHLAVVVGEYGETAGLVSLEDILEELVGEILDEKDVDERTIKRLSREEILVHGQTEVERINRFFNTDLPEDRPTIAGYVLERLGRLPAPGEAVPAEGVTLVVDGVNDRAITRVRIRRERPASTAEGSRAPEPPG